MVLLRAISLAAVLLSQSVAPAYACLLGMAQQTPAREPATTTAPQAHACCPRPVAAQACHRVPGTLDSNAGSCCASGNHPKMVKPSSGQRDLQPSLLVARIAIAPAPPATPLEADSANPSPPRSQRPAVLRI
jgi:hypothetical protein